MIDIKERINNGPLIFDGAMGTYISALDMSFVSGCERACIDEPELVSRIHREYIESGAEAVITNTFAANRLAYPEADAERIIDSAMKLAEEAADGRAYVFADIGQINGSEEIRREEYIWVCSQFIKAGARNFIFDTQSNFTGIAETAAYIREYVPDAFIIASFSVNDAGFSADGLFAGELLKTFRSLGERDGLIDAFGLNCGCSAGHMLQIAGRLNLDGITFSVMPNSGYPVVIDRRTVYEGDPVYFADKISEMAGLGAVMLGGCCGTTPAHIRQIRAKMVSFVQASDNTRSGSVSEGETDDPGSRFWEKLISDKKAVAVELDPPNDADLTKFIKGVRELRSSQKVDIITIADCPIGRARMDSSLLACKVRREEQMEALPHLTCRDRNLNATQALMLGLYAEGIRNMLLVTGDPVPTAERDEVKSVYQFNSRKFALFASGLSERMFPADVHFFGALNVNARNFDIQLKLAREKMENGIIGFLTQPVLTPEAFENLKRAKKELKAYLLGGIIPVVSEKNARFMNSEISGINVDEKVCDMYAGKSREESEDLAVDICSEIAMKIGPYVDGYYIMTPFHRTGLVNRIIDRMEQKGLI